MNAYLYPVEKDHLVPCLLGSLVVCYLVVSVNAVNYGGACIVSGNCTETNTVCTSSVCACSSTTYRNSTACTSKLAFNTTCNIAYGAVQCSVTNTACMLSSSGTYRCTCDTDYYETSGTCTARKRPGVTCAVGQCVINALCTNSTCVCNVGYKATPTITPTACSGVAMVTVNILLFALGVVAQLYFESQH